MSEDESMHCVRAGDAFKIRELAEALAEAGIACVVDTFPPGGAVGPVRARRAAGDTPQMGIYVAPDDRAAAQEAIAEHERSRMPDADGEEPEWAGDPNRCPACGTSITAAETSCAECGLEFPPVVECGACGNLADVAAGTCAVCGAALAT